MPIFAIAHHKGGTGKTTTSVHIVGELDPDESVDLDIHKGLSVINKLRPDNQQRSVHVISDKNELLRLLQKWDEEGKTVFVDCGGFDADITRAAVAVADVIIVPSNDSVTELLGLATFDHTLGQISKQMGVDIHAHILLCKTHPNQKNFPEVEDILKDVKHMSILKNVLPTRTGRYGFTNCLRQGMGITEVRHGRASIAGKEVIALVEEILGLVSA